MFSSEDEYTSLTSLSLSPAPSIVVTSSESSHKVVGRLIKESPVWNYFVYKKSICQIKIEN